METITLKPDPADTSAVSDFISTVDESIKAAVQYLRKTILKADKRVAEKIKWNSPCFYYTGPMKPFDPKEYKRDIAVMNLRGNKLMLVLPTGARVKDDTGLLTGSYTDGRRVIIFKDLADIKSKQDLLTRVLENWISQAC